MTPQEIREKIIANGVKNLREYGFASCNEGNILTDKVYAAFYLKSLPYNLGELNDTVDDVIKSLIKEIESNLKIKVK